MSPTTTPSFPEGPVPTPGRRRRRGSARLRRVIAAVITVGAVGLALTVQAPGRRPDATAGLESYRLISVLMGSSRNVSWTIRA
jgi:hypothetical protein